MAPRFDSIAPRQRMLALLLVTGWAPVTALHYRFRAWGLAQLLLYVTGFVLLVMGRTVRLVLDHTWGCYPANTPLSALTITCQQAGTCGAASATYYVMVIMGAVLVCAGLVVWVLVVVLHRTLYLQYARDVIVRAAVHGPAAQRALYTMCVQSSALSQLERAKLSAAVELRMERVKASLPGAASWELGDSTAGSRDPQQDELRALATDSVLTRHRMFVALLTTGWALPLVAIHYGFLAPAALQLFAQLVGSAVLVYAYTEQLQADVGDGCDAVGTQYGAARGVATPSYAFQVLQGVGIAMMCASLIAWVVELLAHRYLYRKYVCREVVQHRANGAHVQEWLFRRYIVGSQLSTAEAEQIRSDIVARLMRDGGEAAQPLLVPARQPLRLLPLTQSAV